MPSLLGLLVIMAWLPSPFAEAQSRDVVRPRLGAQSGPLDLPRSVREAAESADTGVWAGDEGESADQPTGSHEGESADQPTGSDAAESADSGMGSGAAAIIKDEGWVRILGKALFWDTVADRDTACAACHFNAAADRNIPDQMRARPLVRASTASIAVWDSLSDDPGVSQDQPARSGRGDRESGDRARLDWGRGSWDRGDPDRDSWGRGSWDRGDPDRDSWGRGSWDRGDPDRDSWDRGSWDRGDLDLASWGRGDWDVAAQRDAIEVCADQILAPTAEMSDDPAPRGSARSRKVEFDVRLFGESGDASCELRDSLSFTRELLATRPLEARTLRPDDSLFGANGPHGNLISATGRGLDRTYTWLIQQAFADTLWKRQPPGAGGTTAEHSRMSAELNDSPIKHIATAIAADESATEYDRGAAAAGESTTERDGSANSAYQSATEYNRPATAADESVVEQNFPLFRAIAVMSYESTLPAHHPALDSSSSILDSPVQYARYGGDRPPRR